VDSLGITGIAVTGTAVVVNSSGQLGVAPSSERFKYKIKSMDKTSESILALKPVTFYTRKRLNPKTFHSSALLLRKWKK
jgi:hypothetical protein